MKRRILSSLMALVLVFGLLPATAFAEETPDTEPEVTIAEAPPAEEGETPAGNTIYVDAMNGKDVQDGVGTTADKAYETLKKAVAAAKSGDTIQLGEGNYTLYGVSSEGHTQGKDLTFVGQGADKTGWNIGAEVPNPANFGTEYNGDYSFDGAGTVTFQNMTLRSGSADYLGFIRANNTVVENCTINGKTFYWGYTSATFKNTTFNCPIVEKTFLGIPYTEGDYALWTYSSPTMTFDTCTFNSSGKVINVYTDYSAGTHNITVNFKDCTVKNTANNKQVLNVNDRNMGDYKYFLNISGNNTVSGVKADSITCSRLFGFGGKTANNSGRSVVKFGDTVVWQDGKMVDAKAYHTDGVKVDDVTYDNGGSGAKDILYAEGYKDNKVKTTATDWVEQGDGSYTRTVTRKCDYCDYKEETTEINWNVPKSKTATRLDKKTWTSDVTLSLFDGTATAYTVGAGSTVTDTIGEKFDFASIKSLTVGGTELQSKADGNVTYFGDDANALNDSHYRFKVAYDFANDKFVWTINETLNGSKSVQLTYTVKLTTPETDPGTYGVEDLKGEKVLTDTEAANALYTNASAVLNAKTENNETIVAQNFPKPSVSYTVKSSGGGGGGSSTTYYYFAIEKVDAQDGHALNGAKFGLYLDGKQVATATSNRSGIALFRVSESDYRKINAKSELYYQELTAPEGYVVSSDKIDIEKSDLTTSQTTAEKNAETVRNYQKNAPADLNGDDHVAYVHGYTDGTVKPNNNVTRAETATMLYRLLTESRRNEIQTANNSFSDVSTDDWYNESVSTMANGKYITGYPDGTFGGNKNITRAEFVAMLVRFIGVQNEDCSFIDVSRDYWAYGCIATATKAGWIAGYTDGTFKPEQPITRAEAMTIINRVLNRGVNEKSELMNFRVWPDNDPSAWYYYEVIEASNEHEYTGSRPSENWTSLRIH